MGRSMAAGAVGGLSGGIVFDVLMGILPPRTGYESMTAFAAHVLGVAAPPMVGWFVYPVYGVVIGVLFGWLVRAYAADDFKAAFAGASYGAIWWIIAEVVLIPVLLVRSPFSTPSIQQMRNVAIPLLVGHLAYGLILGVAWRRITRGTIGPARPATTEPPVRRAA